MIKKEEQPQVMRFKILHWADRHNLLINPSKGMEFAIEGFIKVGRCPCDHTQKRLECPCMESLEDIKETGHCLCKLFWKDITTFRKSRLRKVKNEKRTASTYS